jgi:hypothetical protein
MIRVFLLLGLSLHTVAAATGFNGAVMTCLLSQGFCSGGEQHSLSQVYNSAPSGAARQKGLTCSHGLVLPSQGILGFV